MCSLSNYHTGKTRRTPLSRRRGLNASRQPMKIPISITWNTVLRCQGAGEEVRKNQEGYTYEADKGEIKLEKLRHKAALVYLTNSHLISTYRTHTLTRHSSPPPTRGQEECNIGWRKKQKMQLVEDMQQMRNSYGGGNNELSPIQHNLCVQPNVKHQQSLRHKEIIKKELIQRET